MYRLSPLKLFMHRGVEGNAPALARVRRMVEALGRTMEEVVRFDEETVPEVVAELIQLIDVPQFTEAWLNYCKLCNAPEEVREKELGKDYRPPGFKSSHSRITAYAANVLNDRELAERAASELLVREWPGHQPTLKTDTVTGPDVLNPVDEARWVSTNESAQWGLAAMQASALVPEAVSAFK